MAVRRSPPTPSGDLTVDVPALGVKLYRADAGIAVPTVAPVVTMTAPAARRGAARAGRGRRRPVAVGLHRGHVRRFGRRGALRAIGTDDNAPYRVFYDVSGLPAGASLEFKAIADNMSGAISSDKVAAVVGAEAPPTFGGFDYAVVHYNRPAGDYGDHTTGDFNDFWGLHLWGDAIDPSRGHRVARAQAVPRRGRVRPLRLDPAWRRPTARSTSSSTRATPRTPTPTAASTPTPTRRSGSTRATRRSTPARPTPRASSRSATTATTATTARRAPTSTRSGACTCGATRSTRPRRPTGRRRRRPTASTTTAPTGHVDDRRLRPAGQLHHPPRRRQGPGPRRELRPGRHPDGLEAVGRHRDLPVARRGRGHRHIHYHRDDGDYGDNSSPDFNDFWGLHVWEGSVSPNLVARPGPLDRRRRVRPGVRGPRRRRRAAARPTSSIAATRRTLDPTSSCRSIRGATRCGSSPVTNPSDPAEPHYVLPIVGTGAAPGDIDEQRAHWVVGGHDRVGGRW